MEEKLTKRINFLLGKNGCGKSTLLRELEQKLSNNADWAVKYITPERGGSLTYAADIEQNILNNLTWLAETRRRNRFERFREQSVTQFRNLEMFVLREIERDQKLRADHGYTFETVVDEINGLLPLVSLTRSTSGFEVHNRANKVRIDPNLISSGESEAIALAIEALVFSRDSQSREKRLLLIDEPDVHLHPDLQTRYIRFVESLARDKDFKVLVATHSSAMVGSIQDRDECQLAFMPLKRGSDIEFSPVNEIVRSVLPIFGAHPLSNLFNENPVLLVEGDDDQRIWEQVVRSSEGKFLAHPCPVGTVDKIAEWETWLVQKLPTLYDEPKAFSLRDRDAKDGDLEDRPPVIRLRLGCRASENMILSDDTLNFVGTNWNSVVDDCKKWLETYKDHSCYPVMQKFVESGFDRFNADLKELRNILVAILGVSKPWEVLVGQTIAAAILGKRVDGDHGITRYLGNKACVDLLHI